MIGEAQARQLAAQALELSLPDRAEVTLQATASQLTRFAENAVHQNVSESGARLCIHIFQGDRAGSAITNRLEPAGLAAAVQKARLYASQSAADPYLPELVYRAPPEVLKSFDAETANHSPDARAEAVGELCRRAAAGGLRASGAFRAAAEEMAVANSEGTFAYQAGTIADFQTVVMADGSSGWAHAAHWKAGEISVPDLGQEAIRKAMDGRGARTFQPQSMTVVLDPYATADLVLMLNLVGMGAQSILKGQSWMLDRIGKQAMSEAVSIWDDGRGPEGLPLAFDCEGVPKQHLDIVRNGVVQGPVFDGRTAKRLGAASTGHALSPFLPAFARGFGPLAMSLRMAAGDASTEELIASTEHGLYITRFHYTRTVHPRDCVVTGMTRDGVFLIEQGRLAYPIKDLRFTQSYVSALNSVERIGAETRLLTDDFLGMSVHAPAIKIKEFRFTGATA
ncbi:MAG: TldD/PmbA family protein [Anaerolineales bacterium]